jgi:ankyrin repeat protein
MQSNNTHRLSLGLNHYTFIQKNDIKTLKPAYNYSFITHVEKRSSDNLYRAAARGDLETVRYFVENQGQNINSKDSLGWTPLRRAIFNGHLDVVQYIISQGADLNTENQLDLHFLELVALNTHLSVIKYLVEKKNINIGNIFDAAEKSYLGIVTYFVENECHSINAKDNLGWTALHKAAFNGHLNIVQYLVSKGADLNTENKSGKTALNYAVEKDYLEIVKYFIEAQGLDVNAKNSLDWTPLQSAAFHGRFNIVQYLISKGANLNTENKAGKTALNYAVEKAYLEIVKYFIEVQDLDVNTKNSLAWTPLHQAAFNGRLNISRYLVRQGADLESQSNLVDSPLHLAIWNHYSEIIEYLESKAAIHTQRNIKAEIKGAVFFPTTEGIYATTGTNKPSCWLNNVIPILQSISQCIFPTPDTLLPKLAVNPFHMNRDDIKTSGFDVSSTLLLGNLIARKITGKKHNPFFNQRENKRLIVENRIINSINTFESILETKNLDHSPKFKR